MKATHAVCITRKVTYLLANQEPDEVLYFGSRDDMVQELDAQGVPGQAYRTGRETGFHQFGGHKVEWGPTRDDAGFICGCGCTEVVKRDGGFRPGHDAKLVSRLLGKVRVGDMKKADALARLADRPKLQAKLLRSLEK